jgi:hypothetical protein
MSWNVNFIGIPAAIVHALGKQSEQLQGASKTEYDAVLPSLIKLVEANYQNQKGEGYYEPVLHLTASGHTYPTDKPIYGQCSVSLQNTGGQLVEVPQDQLAEKTE